MQWRRQYRLHLGGSGTPAFVPRTAIMGTSRQHKLSAFRWVKPSLRLRLGLSRNKLLELGPVVCTGKRTVWHRGSQEPTERFPPGLGVPFYERPTLSEPPYRIVVPSEVVPAIGREVIAPAQGVIPGGERCHGRRTISWHVRVVVNQGRHHGGIPVIFGPGREDDGSLWIRVYQLLGKDGRGKIGNPLDPSR